MKQSIWLIIFLCLIGFGCGTKEEAGTKIVEGLKDNAGWKGLQKPPKKVADAQDVRDDAPAPTSKTIGSPRRNIELGHLKAMDDELNRKAEDLRATQRELQTAEALCNSSGNLSLEQQANYANRLASAKSHVSSVEFERQKLIETRNALARRLGQPEITP